MKAWGWTMPSRRMHSQGLILPHNVSCNIRSTSMRFAAETRTVDMSRSRLFDSSPAWSECLNILFLTEHSKQKALTRVRAATVCQAGKQWKWSLVISKDIQSRHSFYDAPVGISVMEMSLDFKRFEPVERDTYSRRTSFGLLQDNTLATDGCILRVMWRWSSAKRHGLQHTTHQFSKHEITLVNDYSIEPKLSDEW